MKQIYIYFSLLLISAGGFAQGENNNWYFGDNAALNFATNPPTSLTNSQMTQFEGVASISNSNGQLLFYTDGMTIWGANHLPMPNTGDLTGDYSTTQSALIVPHPANSNLYYVFTLPASDEISPGVLSYSVVDLTLNGGFGDVLPNQKNIPLLDENGNTFDNTSEGITSAVNSNQNGYWVLFPIGNTLYSYPVTAAGFSNTPVTSAMTLQAAPIDGTSHIRVSPDNSRVAISKIGTPRRFRIYNFNNATGQVNTSYEFAVDNALIYTSEFSGNSNVAYANSPFGTLYVFDLVNLQVRIVNQNLRWGTLQRTKFNEIFVPHGNFNSLNDGSAFISRITNIDSYANSVINLNYLTLSAGLGQLGLPQTITALPKPDCPNNITLSTPETNTSFTYKYLVSITANNNYQTSAGQNINFKAGEFILLQPNTEIKTGSVFVAEIEACNSFAPKSSTGPKINAPGKFSLIVDEDDEASLQVYPNPAKELVNITMENTTLQSVTVIGIDGKTVLNVNVPVNDGNYPLNISSLPSGVYILNITTQSGKVISKKLMVQ
ncbi:hypothetical protein AMR72_05450 [Flavobacterium psychrophilum]|nr:hypothetical protein AMR72_05450 [Flavobacterium psychrophilum]AOE52010.1 hypothetical protein ALW18_05445 [Flavobacterium psychrophilum]